MSIAMFLLVVFGILAAGLVLLAGSGLLLGFRVLEIVLGGALDLFDWFVAILSKKPKVEEKPEPPKNNS